MTVNFVVPNVWMRPIHRQKEADRAKWLLSLPGGDHLTLLNAYNQYQRSNPSPTPYYRCLLNTLPSPSPQISGTTNGHGTTTSRNVTSSKPITSGCNSNESWNATTCPSYPTLRTLYPKHNSTRTYGKRCSPDSSCKSRIGILRRRHT